MTSTTVAIVEADSVIVSMRRASTALAEARTIQQTKKILDVAAAAEIYAKRQHLGEEVQDIALSIKVEALRKLGEMLQVAPKNDGARGIGKSGVAASNPTLDDLGLTKRESAVAQKLAALPEDEFEQVRSGHVTVSKAIAAVSAAKPRADPASPENDGPSAEEVREAQRAQEDDASAVRIFLESDDKLAAAMAEIKRQAAQIRILEERVRGLTNEAAQAVRLAKSWRMKCEKLEKATA